MSATASTTHFPMRIYYDASCRFCNAEMRSLMLRNEAGKLIFIDANNGDPQQRLRQRCLRY